MAGLLVAITDFGGRLTYPPPNAILCSKRPAHPLPLTIFAGWCGDDL
jgi:hypothetical protein